MVSGCGQNISFEEDGTPKKIADNYPEYEFSYDKDENVVYLKLLTSVNINYEKKYNSGDVVSSKPSNLMDILPYLEDTDNEYYASEEKKKVISTVESVYEELSKEYKINDVVCNVYNDTRELQGTYSYKNYWQ